VAIIFVSELPFCLGEDSKLPTPGLFFYARGMPVVVTRNQFIGLKVVDRASFKAVDIFPDLAASTITLASDVTLYLSSPVAILLQSDDIAGIIIPGLPKGIILMKSKKVAILDFMRGKAPRSRGKLGFWWVTYRMGLLCTPAFAMTYQKSQGKQFSEVLLNLRGVRGNVIATRLSFISLYMQLLLEIRELTRLFVYLGCFFVSCVCSGEVSSLYP
jgi:ATP-dependent DNA helicase PIF1